MRNPIISSRVKFDPKSPRIEFISRNLQTRPRRLRDVITSSADKIKQLTSIQWSAKKKPEIKMASHSVPLRTEHEASIERSDWKNAPSMSLTKKKQKKRKSRGSRHRRQNPWHPARNPATAIDRGFLASSVTIQPASIAFLPGFYRVLSGFTGFYRVLPGFTGFYL